MTTTSIHRRPSDQSGDAILTTITTYLPPCNIPDITNRLNNGWTFCTYRYQKRKKNHSFIPAKLSLAFFQEGDIANLQKMALKSDFFFLLSNLLVSVLAPLLFVQCRLHYDCKFVHELWFDSQHPSFSSIAVYIAVIFLTVKKKTYIHHCNLILYFHDFYNISIKLKCGHV